MSLYNTRGIYRIRNLVNGKMYIGFTSMNFGDRRDSHFACLRNNYHFNHDLQNDFNKYGESNFVFEVVEEIESDDILKYQEKEIYYISLYDTVNTGYNYTAGGNNHIRPTREKIRQMAEINRITNTGKRVSEDTKKRMSVSHRKRKDLSKPNILSEKDVIDIKNRFNCHIKKIIKKEENNNKKENNDFSLFLDISEISYINFNEYDEFMDIDELKNYDYTDFI